MSTEESRPKEESTQPQPTPLPATEAPVKPPAHPAGHRHEHAVIHPANPSVTHLNPGGTVHI